MPNWMIVLALLVVIALAAYAFVLWRRVWAAGKQREQREAERNERLAADIRFLSQSLLEGQVPLIEGTIRIKVLLDNYSGPRRSGLQIDIFERVYDSTSHIPTHQGWKDLPRSERDQYRAHMDEIERTQRPEIERAAQQLSQGLS
jgi:type II secretory pathway pseudopilin PulG